MAVKVRNQLTLLDIHCPRGSEGEISADSITVDIHCPLGSEGGKSADFLRYPLRRNISPRGNEGEKSADFLTYLLRMTNSAKLLVPSHMTITLLVSIIQP